jgi:hypothetical protein
MGFFAKALIPFIVLLVFALARKYMPAVPRKTSEYKYSREELDVRFSSAQWTVGFVMVVVGVFFAFGTHAVLAGLNRYFATANGTAQFLILPSSAIWWFFPGFGALCLSWGITQGLWVLVGHSEDANLYDYWSGLKTGFDAPKMLRWLAVLIALPIGILTFLALPIHTALGQDEIRDCGYAFAPCKIYRYADARRMTIIDGFRNRDGTLTQRAAIVVDFADGHRWSSVNNDDFKKSVDPALEELLENKTRLTYNYAQTEADIPALSLGNRSSGW